MANFWNKAGVYGLLLALVTVIFLLIPSVLTDLSSGVSVALNLIKLALTVFLLYYFMKDYGKSLEKYEYSDAFKFGMAISLCSSVVAVAYYFIHISYLFPEASDQFMQVMEQAIAQSGTSQEVDMNLFANKLPAILCISQFFYFNIIGLLWSSLLANAAKHQVPKTPFV